MDKEKNVGITIIYNGFLIYIANLLIVCTIPVFLQSNEGIIMPLHFGDIILSRQLYVVNYSKQLISSIWTFNHIFQT